MVPAITVEITNQFIDLRLRTLVSQYQQKPHNVTVTATTRHSFRHDPIEQLLRFGGIERFQVLIGRKRLISLAGP